MMTKINIFMLLTVLGVQWLRTIYEKAVIRGVNVARRVSVERRVATVSRFLHVRSPKKESLASPVTEILEVVRVSKNIRQTSSEAIRLSAKRCEIATCVRRV
jgi:ABC-type branched-subunit amino acid transport system ATPase component